ncbi:MAG: putative colanic biosynthesis UDP-glucose lipid carrier transferase [Bacteroidota bacterium]|jgi:lipopolysaccharide/colanic/teichoic acid biosynthesis glycosyltransferase
MKRAFDIIFSFFGLLALFPFFLFIGIWILIDSPGGIFYRQTRVGRNNSDFRLWKFRSMRPDSDKKGLLTVGGRDPRITNSGYFIRKYKIDELPQLINVLTGDMSFVGPRPEVRRYVDLYNEEQKRVLLVRPGITDIASLEYFEENELLGKSSDPERTYIDEIMPAKLKLNLQYIDKANLATDLGMIFKTVARIFK